VAADKEITRKPLPELDSAALGAMAIMIDQVGGIVSEISGKDVPEKSVDLASLGIDSITKLEILASLEERLDIVLNESVVEEFHSVGHIAHIIRDAIRAKSTR
jgi:acyl carrier protein